MTEPHTQGSTTEVLNDSSENVDFIRTNTVPGNKSYDDVAMSSKTKIGITKKVIVFGHNVIRGISVREFNNRFKMVMLNSDLFLIVIARKCYIMLSQMFHYMGVF